MPLHTVRVLCVVVMLLMTAPLVWGFSNTHGVADPAREQAAWWGDAGQPYVREGCIHGLSATTSVAIASCQAYMDDTSAPERLRYVTESSRTVTYNAGDGTYWLIVHATLGDVVAGWTRVAGTPYLWQVNAAHPTTIPNNALLVMASTVAGGAITAVDTTLHNTHPFIFDRTEYASRYGFKCDGLASSAESNNVALEEAMAALPLSGGRVVMPATRLTCTLARAFAPEKNIHLQGAGGGRVNGGFWWRTRLEYVGVGGNIIEILNKPTVGSHLEGFDITNTGSAAVGINMAFTSNLHIEDVSMSIINQGVKFTDAAIIIGDVTTAHTVTLSRVYIRDTGPTGLRIQRTNHTKIADSSFRHHEVCNIDVGGGVGGRAKDTHIVTTALENTKLGATAVCVFDAEHLVIHRSHFEQSHESFAAISVPSTASQAENLVIDRNWFTVIFTPPSSTHLIHFDRSNTFATISNNSLIIEEGSTLVSGAWVSVPNLNGAGYITMRDNFANDHNFLVPMVEIDNPRYVVGHPQLSGNITIGIGAEHLPTTPDSVGPWCIYGELVGSRTTGETILQTCTIPKRTLYRPNRTGFRLTSNGFFGTNANNKRVRIRRKDLTGIVLWDTGTVTLNAAEGTLPGNWHVNCLFVRSGTLNTPLRGGCHGGAALSAVAGATFVESTGSNGDTGTGWDTHDQVIIVTGEAATADDDVIIGTTLLEVIR